MSDWTEIGKAVKVELDGQEQTLFAEATVSIKPALNPGSISLKDLEETARTMDQLMFGVVTGIYGRPATLIRLAHELMPKGHEIMESKELGNNMTPLSAVKMIESNNWPEGYVEMSFHGKSSEVYKLW